ncbi:Disease resistance protein [Camellia lanceoleosa]|uniref:Disease resistance protein n=1 Tax=Camellia lanceoleosa TaxID=1840588 RepID=A0ACC0IQG0_9ERIC|nr:Disease resistance protein [Camellia lanceoleosa]
MEKIQEVAELQENGRFANGLLIDVLPTSGQFKPTMGSFCENTSARNMENVWKYLMDDERQIAKAVNLDLLSYSDETKRASELYTTFFQTKRYVLILDDLWKAFPLDKVGIPEPSISNGCKLVLTTRSLEVCRKMECRAVKVELLTEDEAPNQFMSKVEEHQTVEIATKVAKECALLPLAITTIAGRLCKTEVCAITGETKGIERVKTEKKSEVPQGIEELVNLEISTSLGITISETFPSLEVKRRPNSNALGLMQQEQKCQQKSSYA